MWSNEGAAPLHAWRWKRKPASKEENNNSSVEEEASDLFLCDDEVDGIQSGARVLIAYWRSWHGVACCMFSILFFFSFFQMSM